MKKLLLLLMIVPMIGFGQCISGDCENGYGTYIWANGDKCVGEWKDGDINGLATFTYGKGEWEGDKYVGEYKDDTRYGQGTYTFASGAKYVGEWKDDNMHGQGTMTYVDGTVEEGQWENDKFLGN